MNNITVVYVQRHVLINLYSTGAHKYEKNLLPFASWSSMEYSGGELTIHFSAPAFPTRAPEWSDKFLRQIG